MNGVQNGSRISALTRNLLSDMSSAALFVKKSIKDVFTSPIIASPIVASPINFTKSLLGIRTLLNVRSVCTFYKLYTLAGTSIIFAGFFTIVRMLPSIVQKMSPNTLAPKIAMVYSYVGGLMTLRNMLSDPQIQNSMWFPIVAPSILLGLTMSTAFCNFLESEDAKNSNAQKAKIANDVTENVSSEAKESENQNEEIANVQDSNVAVELTLARPVSKNNKDSKVSEPSSPEIEMIAEKSTNAATTDKQGTAVISAA